jgi:hypothetical protein
VVFGSAIRGSSSRIAKCYKIMSKEQLDILISKWISRKLMVFIIASIGLFASTLESSDWVIIATAYISIEGATNIVERLMKAKSIK